MLCENTARSIGGASQAIQQRHIANCRRADPAYGAGVEKALAAGVKTPTPNKVVRASRAARYSLRIKPSRSTARFSSA